ncbi:unnamed protein product [Prorocentrum cordatum]|uniref:PAS domain-containing protein n=1 Tax=Prorocentrum cordatum TaxID=2364126 RepID=A0ABN9V7W7_9DINO|nr:unnamed protein product [Polarella glacialis]
MDGEAPDGLVEAPVDGILQGVPVNLVQPAAQLAAVICIVSLLGDYMSKLRAGSASCGCLKTLKEILGTLRQVIHSGSGPNHELTSKRARSKRVAVGLILCRYTKWGLLIIPFGTIGADGIFFLLHYTAFFIYATFVSIAPSRHTHRVQHAAYLFFMASYSLGLSPLVMSFGGPESNPEWYIRRALYASGMFSLYDISLLINIVGNCSMWGSLFVTAVVHGGDGTCSGEDVLGTIVACWLGIIAWTVLCNVVFIDGVIREVQILTVQRELKAADSILQGTCDAVVVLDQGLKVTQGAESVANMLMMSPPKIQGESVLSLIATEEERERFEDMVRGARSSAFPGPCTAFNTSLKDSVAISCTVEALCVKYLQADGGGESFLLGFREADLPAVPRLTTFSSSVPRSRRSRPPPPPAEQLVEHPQAMRSARSTDALAAQDDSSDGASSSTGQSSDSDDACTPTGCRPPALWFDPSSPEFELVKSSAEFRMLTGFTDEEMTNLGGVLTWVRNEQREAFATWVRNFADGTQNQESQRSDARAGVKLCIESEKHKAQFQAEVHLETCWSKAIPMTLKLVVHGFRARQKNTNKGRSRRTRERRDDSSDADEATPHEGKRRVRSEDFEVRDSGLHVQCDIGNGESDNDPLVVTRSISPGLQLLLGTGDSGQDVCDLFAQTEVDRLESWLHEEYFARSQRNDASSATSHWFSLKMPALETLDVRIEVNCRLAFQRGDLGMCLVIQRMRWSPIKGLTRAKTRRRPRTVGTPARVDSAMLDTLSGHVSL